MTKKKQESAQASKRRRTTVQHEELAPGTVLTARVKGRELSASVVTGPEGTPEVEFEGARYPSLSAAGKGFLFADRGEDVLRGFEDPVRLYEVRWRE